MASDRELKLRIKSVQSIGQLTKAMKMVASAQLRKIEGMTAAGRPYAEKLKEAITEMTSRLGDDIHPLMAVREVTKTGVIIIGSDSGLCGAYNSNVFKVAGKALDDMEDDPARMILLGSKATRFFTRRGYKPDKTVLDWKPEYELAKELADMCAAWFLSGEIDEVICYYTQPVNKLVSKPKSMRILPMAESDGKVSGVPYIFEPSAKEALERIMPSYLRILFRQILFDSKSAELGSRLNAMSNATDNADKLAAELTLQYYRIRQNNITTEIIEISSGAEALNS
ncbi:MAG: ATP synthase F1 subunit gamma [bacterium]|nr:ATP synthase F1 subunit gamma [bacterium]